MNFTPKSEAEVGFKLLEPGVYPFQVIFAESKVSQAGNPMINMKLLITDSTGRASTVRDFLMEKIDYKLRHFCFSVGLEETYTSGALTPDFCSGREGYAKIAVDQYTTKDGREGEKNIVQDYLLKNQWPTAVKAQALAPTQSPAAAADDDDVPF
jgi:hypothetical protein